jgi:hypothetical protein
MNTNPEAAWELLKAASINEQCSSWPGDGFGYMTPNRDEKGNVVGYSGFVTDGPAIG